eukprot:1650799-Alexandrium_andersonii.AAC.1
MSNRCAQFWKLPDGSDGPRGKAPARGGHDLRLVDVGVDFSGLLATVGEGPVPVAAIRAFELANHGVVRVEVPGLLEQPLEGAPSRVIYELVTLREPLEGVGG